MVKKTFRRVLLIKIAVLAIFIMAPLSMAQYGDPGPPPVPDTPRVQDPREIEAGDPAFAPDNILDAPDPALGEDSVISEPESFDMDPGPGGIAREPYNVDLPPGGVVTEPDSMVEQREPLVEGDPLIRQPEGLVEQGEPLVEQPDPLVRQPAALVPQGEPMGGHGAGGRGVR